jgi:hypothetical protein
MEENLKQKIDKICKDKIPLDADKIFEDLTAVPGRAWKNST